MLTLQEMDFSLAGQIDAQRGEVGEVLTYQPAGRFANPRRLPLNRHGAGPFSRLAVPALPKNPGVYALLDQNGRVLYIGRARDSLASRWGRGGYSVIDPRNCYVGGQATNCHINGLLTQGLLRGDTYTLWTHSTEAPVPTEAALLIALRPPWNLR